MPRKELRLLVLPEAEEAIRAIYDPLYSVIIHRLRQLQKFPEMGEELGPPLVGWRSLHIKMFTVIYRIIPRGVEVAYVRHAKRQLPTIEEG